MIKQKHFAKALNYNKNKGNTKKLFNRLLKKYLKNMKESSLIFRQNYRTQTIYFEYNSNHPDLLSYDFSSGVSHAFDEDFKNKIFIKKEIEEELTKRGFSFEWKPQKNDDIEMWLNIYFFK